MAADSSEGRSPGDDGGAEARARSAVFHSHAFVMVAALSSASVVNLLYIRHLGATLSEASLGVFFTAQTVLMVFGAGGAAVQTAVAGGTAHLHALFGRGPVLGFSKAWLRRMGFCSLVLLFAFAALSVPAAHFFHFSSPVTFVAVGVALAFYAFVPVLIGVFQGLQSFLVVAALYLTDVGARLGSALLLDALGLLDEKGAILTLDLAFLSVVAVFAPLLWLGLGPWARKGVRWEEKETPRELWPVALSLLSLSTFTYLDVLAVQKFFGGAGDPWQGGGSGVYGAAAYIGRSLILITLPLVTVVFPKVRAGRSAGENTFPHLARALVSVAVVSLPLAGACVLFAEEVARLLFPTLAAAPLVRLYALAVLPYVFLTVLVYYNLAVRETWVSRVLPAAIAVQAAGYLLFHRSHGQIIAVLGLTGLGLLLPVAVATVARSLRAAPAPSGPGAGDGVRP